MVTACRPRVCGRMVRDDIFNATQLEMLRAAADGLMNITGGASGGVRATI